MAISSRQLRSETDVMFFWGDPFGHEKINYSERPADDLNDLVGFAFFESYAATLADDELLGDGTLLGGSEAIHALRKQFVEVLIAFARDYHDSGPNFGARLLSGSPVHVGPRKDTKGCEGPCLTLQWSVETTEAEEVVFLLTGYGLGGVESRERRARLSLRALDGPGKEAAKVKLDKLEHFHFWNNVTYAIVRLWQLSRWCDENGLGAVGRILQVTIDAIGSQYGDINLLTEQVELFQRVQGSARGSALSHILSDRS